MSIACYCSCHNNSLTFRHINEAKQNEYLQNLTLQIFVLDADNCSSVSKAKSLLSRPALRGGLVCWVGWEARAVVLQLLSLFKIQIPV